MTHLPEIILRIRQKRSLKPVMAILCSALFWLIFCGCWFISELLTFLPIPLIIIGALLFFAQSAKPRPDSDSDRWLKTVGMILFINSVLGILMFLFGFVCFFITIFVSRGSLVIVDTLPLLAERQQYLIGTQEVPRLIYLVLKSSCAFALCGISFLLIAVWGLPHGKAIRR